MVTIATIEKFIEQHPNAPFKDALGMVTSLPTNENDWFKGIQDVYIAWLATGHSVTLQELSLAVYDYWTDPNEVPSWADRVTSAQLTMVLTDLKQPNADKTGPSNTPAFSDPAKITSAVKSHYLDIKVTIDADAAISKYNENRTSGYIVINHYTKLKDNHPATSRGENTDELASEGLQPNMTITWTAVSKLNDHSITLTRFEHRPGLGNPFTDLAPNPVHMPGSPNIWVTKAHPTLPKNESSQYQFFLTISGCDGKFTFDPFIGTKKDTNL